MKDLLRIGQFARLCDISVKALRYYDAEGLLRPALVDPDSGYRYYSVGQAQQLNLVTNLRAAGFSIRDIAALVDRGAGEASLAERVAAQRRRLADELDAINRQIRMLDTLVDSLHGQPEQAWSAVKLRSVPAELVHVLSGPCPGEDSDIAALFEHAETTVARCNARRDAPPFMMIHQADPGRVQVCIPVRAGQAAGLDTCVIEGAELACSLVYAGDYAQTDRLRGRMQDWIRRVGLQVRGPLREIYHRFGADQQGYRLPARVLAGTNQEFLTELLLPISPRPEEA